MTRNSPHRVVQRISLSLPPEEIEFLERFKADTNLSMSWLVGRLVRLYREAEGTFDLGPLIRSGHGPPARGPVDTTADDSAPAQEG